MRKPDLQIRLSHFLGPDFEEISISLPSNLANISQQ